MELAADQKSQDISFDVASLIGEINIAEKLHEEVLTKIGAAVCIAFDEDEASRKDWLEIYAKAIAIANQVTEKKSYPWEGASNVKFPLLTIGALQFHARAYPALLPSKGKVSALAVGIDPDGIKEKQAKRVSLHMNYQLDYDMENWEEDMDKLLMTLPITGCEFKKTYFDPSKKKNVSEYVRATDLAVHYYAKSLETAARKTHILAMTNNEIKGYQLQSLFRSIPLDPPTPRDDKVTKTAAQATGMKPPKDDSATPRQVLEQHTYLDLDQDGYNEPYIITVDYKSKKVLRIITRFEKDDIERSGGKIVRITPTEYFTKFDFVPNPSGAFYGIGFGILIGPLNEAVNTLINQLVDGGTLSNLQSGFVSRNLRINGGSYNFKPGEWKWVNATGQELSSGIFPLPVREPSMVLFQLLTLLVNAGERLTSTTDMMVGENPGQNQKATTTMAVLDQGQKVFTAVYKRIRVALSKEFRKIFDLNEDNLDGTDYFFLFDNGTGKNAAYSVYKEDYDSKGIKIIPSADPNTSSQVERVQKAVALKQTAMSLPHMYNMHEVERRLLDALEIDGIDKVLLEPDQIQPPQPDAKLLEVNRKATKDQVDAELAVADLKIKQLKTEHAMAKDEATLQINAKNAQTQELKTFGDISIKTGDNIIKAKKVANDAKADRIKANESNSK